MPARVAATSIDSCPHRRFPPKGRYPAPPSATAPGRGIAGQAAKATAAGLAVVAVGIRPLAGEEHRDPAPARAHLRRRDPPWCRVAPPAPRPGAGGDPALLHRGRRDHHALLLACPPAGDSRGRARARPARGERRCRAPLHRGQARRAGLAQPAPRAASVRKRPHPPGRHLRAQGVERGHRDLLHPRRNVVLGLGTRPDDRAADRARSGEQAREGAPDVPRHRPPARLLHTREVRDGLRDRGRSRGRLLPDRAQLLAARRAAS